MALAIFDLDQTLLGGDSDFLWGEFLVSVGAVDQHTYQQRNQKFFDDYTQGKFNIQRYLSFCLAPLTKYPLSQLQIWRNEFITKKIKPIILSESIKTIEKHRKNKDTLLVITATNQFVAEKIVALYNIPNLVATNAEFDGNAYTGKSVGVPCFQEGKIINLKLWLEKNDYNLTNSYFYSDSFNDLPLLKLVDNPVVVNGDDKLLEFAKTNNWQILNWKTP